MPTLSNTVLLCIAIELAVVWVLRQRTFILRRTRLERLMYVAGLGTLVTQPFAWFLVHGFAPRIGFTEMTVATQFAVMAVETALYHVLGRIGWKKAATFSALANGAAMIVLLGLYVAASR